MPSANQIAAGVAAAGIIAGGGSLAADAAINPYTSVNVVQNGVSMPALAIAASSTIPDAGTVQTTVETTQPGIVLSKWSGQVNMGVTYEGLPATTTGARPFMSKDVDWNGATQSMQVVPLAASTTMEDGGMEINIILNSEPATNTFDFAVSGADDLDFYYQPPLWQEAGLNAPTPDCTDTDCNIPDEGPMNRPENVVGSYAVYYKNHENYCSNCGTPNYATGKAYQIFRPLVTDASGTSTWATLSYSNGVLSVTVPRDFLDSATYPVTVDPTFGYTTAGASSSIINGVIGGSPSSNSNNPTSNGTVTSITIISTGTFSASAQTALYNANATFNAGSSQLTSEAATQAFPISASVTANTSYYIVGWANAAYQIKADTGSSGNVSFAQTYVTNTWPATLTSESSTVIKSIYATYTVSASNTFAPWQFNDF